MESADRLNTRASKLLEEARRFQSAAAQPGCHIEAPDALASLEEALQVLSAAWYQLAADGSPGIVKRRRGRASQARARPRFDGVSREQEVRLMGALHDVAAAFARCARACREGRSEVTPIIARRVAAGRQTIGATATNSLASRGTSDRGSASHDRRVGFEALLALDCGPRTISVSDC